MAAAKKGPGDLAARLAGGPPPAPAEDSAMEAKVLAMEDLKAAFDAGDMDAAAMAFKRAYDACAAAKGDEYEED